MPSAQCVSSSGSRSTGVSPLYTRSDIKSSAKRCSEACPCRVYLACDVAAAKLAGPATWNQAGQREDDRDVHVAGPEEERHGGLHDQVSGAERPPGSVPQ